MKLRKSSLPFALCVLAVAWLTFAPHLFAATGHAEITGTVYASTWDDNDNVTGVVIVTEEGDEYAVSQAESGKELLKLESRVVRATGTVTTDQNGKKTITVSKYVVEE